MNAESPRGPARAGSYAVNAESRRQGAASEGGGFLLVADAEGLGTVRLALAETALVGLDIETTGLDPRSDRVRLLTLDCDTTDGGRFSYLIDCFAVDPRPLFDVLAERQLIAHSAVFDLAFLARLGFESDAAVHCTESSRSPGTPVTAPASAPRPDGSSSREITPRSSCASRPRSPATGACSRRTRAARTCTRSPPGR
jgi:hypothetical protein